MTWELVAFVALVGVLTLLALREHRLRRPVRLKKQLQGLAKSHQSLAEYANKLPTSADLESFHQRLEKLEQSTGGTGSVAMKALVDRMNQLSHDLTEVKAALADHKNRITRLETTGKWASIGKKESAGG